MTDTKHPCMVCQETHTLRPFRVTHTKRVCYKICVIRQFCMTHTKYSCMVCQRTHTLRLFRIAHTKPLCVITYVLYVYCV